MILPVLGDPLADVVERFEIADGELRLGPQRFPLAAGTTALDPAAALERQHYRLQWWRDPARNVRRFFTIDDLVGVRVEQPDIAAVVDTVPRLLADHEAFAGVRVDHVDGLADPLGYLDGLRLTIGDRWLVVEKILAGDETLPASWPVDGTTGYEHAAILEHALLDRDGWRRLEHGWVEATGDGRPFPAWELAARREVLHGGLRPDLERATRAAAAVLDLPPDDVLAAAVEALSVHLRRYRTYLPDEEGHPALEAAIAAATADRPDLAMTILALAAALETPGEWRTRWQQLTGPATAKGVEDRAFWRYLPLASLAEVGGHPVPDEASDAVASLHHHHARTAGSWPRTLLAGTTHDVARSADVRAGGLVLATVAGQWEELFAEWAAGPGAVVDVDPATQWLALQTVLTTPGLDVERFAAFLVKAAREAAVRTSWTQPDETYEAGVTRLAGVALTWKPVVAATRLVDGPARAAALAMLVARVTAPGVADVYQGTEAFRHVLVDPDNRADPQHAALDALVGGRRRSTGGRRGPRTARPPPRRSCSPACSVPSTSPTATPRCRRRTG